MAEEPSAEVAVNRVVIHDRVNVDLRRYRKRHPFELNASVWVHVSLRDLTVI